MHMQYLLCYDAVYKGRQELYTQVTYVLSVD